MPFLVFITLHFSALQETPRGRNGETVLC